MKPDLSCFFEPKGIAVVGATPDKRKGGYSLLIFDEIHRLVKVMSFLF